MPLNSRTMLAPVSLAIKQVSELVKAEEPELELILAHIQQVMKECNISTSTELLGRYEKIFGLSAGGKSVEERRAELLLYLNARLTITPAYMEQLLTSVLLCPVKIYEHFSEYTMTVDIEGGQHSPDFWEAWRYTHLLKPAHIYTTLHYRHMADGGVYVAARPRMGVRIMVLPYQPENIETEAQLAIAARPRIGLRVYINPKGD